MNDYNEDENELMSMFGDANLQENVSKFATVPEGLTREEFSDWFDNLTDEDFVELIVD
tara:strand:- start:1064 stop:1237 length:174 start_codon:yes stop_codon:yes gene_type:complete